MRDISRALGRLQRRRVSGDEAPVVTACERLRSELAGREELVGDAFEADDGTASVVVGDEVRRASAPPAKALLLYRLAVSVAPGKVVELGSAFGVSGAYLSAGLAAGGGGSFVTIEAAASRSRIAAETLERVPSPQVVQRLVVGLFDDHLAELTGADLVYVDGNHFAAPTRAYVEEALARGAPDLLIALDDIDGYSEEMDRLWEELRRDARFTCSGRLGDLGVLSAGRRRL